MGVVLDWCSAESLIEGLSNIDGFRVSIVRRPGFRSFRVDLKVSIGPVCIYTS